MTNFKENDLVCCISVMKAKQSKYYNKEDNTIFDWDIDLWYGLRIPLKVLKVWKYNINSSNLVLLQQGNNIFMLPNELLTYYKEK